MTDEGGKVDTIEKLAVEMREGFVQSDQKIEKLAVEMREGFEQLAALTANGFRDVYEKIGGLEDKVGTLEKKVDIGFEQVNGKIDGINRRIDNEADQRVELGLRVEKVEAKVFPELQR